MIFWGFGWGEYKYECELVSQKATFGGAFKAITCKAASVFEDSLLLLVFPAEAGLPSISSLKKKKTVLKLNQQGK